MGGADVGAGVGVAGLVVGLEDVVGVGDDDDGEVDGEGDAGDDDDDDGDDDDEGGGVEDDGDEDDDDDGELLGLAPSVADGLAGSSGLADGDALSSGAVASPSSCSVGLADGSPAMMSLMLCWKPSRSAWIWSRGSVVMVAA